MVREVASKTNDIAGDGTTTATILAAAIVREGAKSVAAGMNPMDLKRGVDMAVDAIVADLAKRTKKVTTSEEIAQVGTISANGEREVGRMLAEAMQKVGNEGVITVEEAKSLETELDIVEGMQFDRGYISPYFVTEQREDAGRARGSLHPHPREEARRTCRRCCRCSRRWCRAASRFLIIAEDVEGEALATLVVNKLRGGLKVAAVKAPGLRRSPQGDARGHRDPDGGPGDLRGCRDQARERHARHARPRQARRDREGEHDGHRRRRCEGRDHRSAATRSGRRSRRPPRTTTARSCRSVWRSWPAALP